MHSKLHVVYWLFTTIQSRIGTGMINAHTGAYCAGLLGPHNKSPYYVYYYTLIHIKIKRKIPAIAGIVFIRMRRTILQPHSFQYTGCPTLCTPI